MCVNAQLEAINNCTYKIYLVSWRSRFVSLIFEAKHSHYPFYIEGGKCYFSFIWV